MLEGSAFDASGEQMGEEMPHPGVLTTSHPGKGDAWGRCSSAAHLPGPALGVVLSQASHSSNVSSCLIREITYFSFFIGLMCVSVHIKVYKYIFLINVLYFLA